MFRRLTLGVNAPLGAGLLAAEFHLKKKSNHGFSHRIFINYSMLYDTDTFMLIPY
jgi:hypothetical protein